MLAKSLLILSLAAIGSSFTLKGGLSNGLYKAYYNTAGEEVHELVTADTLNTIRGRMSSPSKRWSVGEVWCGCAFPMNAGDTNVANSVMANWAASSPQLGAYAAEYYIQNTAVAFACNYAGGAVRVPSNMVSGTTPGISYKCGNFIAGTAQLNGFAHLDYGYMNYFSGLNICGAAQSSGESYCPNSAAGQCNKCVDDCNDECSDPENPLAEGICSAACRSAGHCTGTC